MRSPHGEVRAGLGGSGWAVFVEWWLVAFQAGKDRLGPSHSGEHHQAGSRGPTAHWAPPGEAEACLLCSG